MNTSMNSTEHRSLLEPRRVGIIAIVVAVVVGLMALGLPRLAADGGNNTAGLGDVVDVERRQVVEPPKELVNFTLTNQDGEEFRLSDLNGKPTLLFFGFTHCPDVCPTTMAEYRIIKRELGDVGDDVNFVLVSVDGTRDTPEALRAYVDKFDPTFIGLTGDEDYVRRIGQDYFLYFNRAVTEGTQSAAGYMVDHTSYSYLIDPDGKLRFIYPFQAPRETIIGDIQKLIS